jgi:hypothetical protein
MVYFESKGSVIKKLVARKTMTIIIIKTTIYAGSVIAHNLVEKRKRKGKIGGGAMQMW